MKISQGENHSTYHWRAVVTQSRWQWGRGLCYAIPANVVMSASSIMPILSTVVWPYSPHFVAIHCRLDQCSIPERGSSWSSYSNTIALLLNLVPQFCMKLLKSLAEDNSSTEIPVSRVDMALVPTILLMDMRIPLIKARYQGQTFNNVMINGGLGVNIVTLKTCTKIGWSS